MRVQSITGDFEEHANFPTIWYIQFVHLQNLFEKSFSVQNAHNPPLEVNLEGARIRKKYNCIAL